MNENKEWVEFVENFKTYHDTKDQNSLMEIINVPLYDRRKDWDKPKELNEKKDLEKLVNDILNAQLYLDNPYENSISFVFYDVTDKYFSECYRIDADNMFLYFKKINDKIKLVTISNTFG